MLGRPKPATGGCAATGPCRPGRHTAPPPVKGTVAWLSGRFWAVERSAQPGRNRYRANSVSRAQAHRKRGTATVFRRTAVPTKWVMLRGNAAAPSATTAASELEAGAGLRERSRRGSVVHRRLQRATGKSKSRKPRLRRPLALSNVVHVWLVFENLVIYLSLVLTCLLCFGRYPLQLPINLDSVFAFVKINNLDLHLCNNMSFVLEPVNPNRGNLDFVVLWLLAI
jgi:hypothetical protein